MGLAERVRFSPFVSDRVELARLYREAACVVDPGPHETFGLVVFEAAASGARVIACDETPAAAVADGLIDTFTAGDVIDLTRALRRALARDENLAAAAALAERSTWQRVFCAELEAVEKLNPHRPRPKSSPAARRPKSG